MSGLFKRLSTRRSAGPEGTDPPQAAEPGTADVPTSTPEPEGHKSLLTDPAAETRVLREGEQPTGMTSGDPLAARPDESASFARPASADEPPHGSDEPAPAQAAADPAPQADPGPAAAGPAPIADPGPAAVGPAPMVDPGPAAATPSAPAPFAAPVEANPFVPPPFAPQPALARAPIKKTPSCLTASLTLPAAASAHGL